MTLSAKETLSNLIYSIEEAIGLYEAVINDYDSAEVASSFDIKTSRAHLRSASSLEVQCQDLHERLLEVGVTVIRSTWKRGHVAHRQINRMSPKACERHAIKRLNFLKQENVNFRLIYETRYPPTKDKQLIAVPPQSRALRVKIQDGKLVRDLVIDAEGNDNRLITALKPGMLEALEFALKECGSGNKAFGLLADKLNDYQIILNQPNSEIDFGLLYVRATAMSTALKHAKVRTKDPDDADLSESAINAVETVLELNKPLMSASGLGESLQQASINWDTTPEEIRKDKANIKTVYGEISDNPSLTAPDSREDFLNALNIPEDSTDIKAVAMAARTAGNIAKALVKDPILFHIVGGSLLLIPGPGQIVGGLVIAGGLTKGMNTDAGQELRVDFTAANKHLGQFLNNTYEALLNLTSRVDESSWLSRIITRKTVPRYSSNAFPDSQAENVKRYYWQEIFHNLLKLYPKTTGGGF